jgi:hypothetical protein
VVAVIDPDNEPSKRVATRLGMKYEATYTGSQLGHRLPEIVVDLFSREAFPVFEVAQGTDPITLEHVSDALDEK